MATTNNRQRQAEVGGTFLDRRRQFLQDLIRGYGGDPEDAQKYLDMWLTGRLRQIDVEMIVAKDHGATSEELAEQFGYSNSDHARSAITRARHKIERGG